MKTKIRKALSVVMAGIMAFSITLLTATDTIPNYNGERINELKVESTIPTEGIVLLENTIGISDELFESFERFVQIRQIDDDYVRIQGFSDTNAIYIDAGVMAVQFEALIALDYMGVRDVNVWLEDTRADIAFGQ